MLGRGHTRCRRSLRARRPELKQQLDQVQHVDGAVAVDILAGVAGRIVRQTEAQQQIDQVQHVDGAVAVDILARVAGRGGRLAEACPWES